MNRLVGFLSLMSSSATLVCCAIPALLVALGMGAALAGFVSAFPQIVWMSENKLIVFGFAGSMLMVTGLARWWVRNEACPIDPLQAQACGSAKKMSNWVYWLSVSLFLTGSLFAYGLPLIQE